MKKNSKINTIYQTKIFRNIKETYINEFLKEIGGRFVSMHTNSSGGYSYQGSGILETTHTIVYKQLPIKENKP